MTNSQILIYQTEDGQTKVQTRLEDETVWLSIDQMSELFQKSRSTINEHILNIFKENELEKETSMRKIGNSDFSTKPTNFYNLDVIISVGYRVKSLQGTKFRQWATARLKEYIVKGFTMNDELLKNAGGGNYFEELLARIRDIRSSEKVFWRKVLDIYATSIDYDPKAELSIQFFQTVQNKCTGQLMVTPQQRSFMKEQMQKKQIWDLPISKVPSPQNRKPELLKTT